MHIKSFALAILVLMTSAVHAETVVNRSAVVGTQVNTVKSAKKAKDDTRTVLTGKIVKSLGNERYEFADNTGTIIVDIDDDLWQGRELTDTQEITLVGEVDINHTWRGKKQVEIDVKSVRF